MDRVFVDANVIFSAAYNPRRRIASLWDLPDTEIVTSAYAAGEALRNLRRKFPSRIPELRALLARTGLVPSAGAIPAGIASQLHHKDHPILAAGIVDFVDVRDVASGNHEHVPRVARLLQQARKNRRVLIAKCEHARRQLPAHDPAEHSLKRKAGSLK